MADVEHDTGFISIGEVLDLLVQEFPDVTISKIRFLESQGLISPQRTASGYRKFYDEDVELLRVILTEQRQNFLPLKVIRDRLETGEIDPTGEHLRPNPADIPDETPSGGVPADSVAQHPAARKAPTTSIPPPRPAATPASKSPQPPSIMPGVSVGRDEFCALASLNDAELEALESFGVVVPETDGGAPGYTAAHVAIARPAGEFLRLGVDARHLRSLRTAAEREASLFEQLVAPRMRQRNPQAKAEALERLQELEQLGGQLRNALMRDLLSSHLER